MGAELCLSPAPAQAVTDSVSNLIVNGAPSIDGGK
jgi:hypothetical protein